VALQSPQQKEVKLIPWRSLIRVSVPPEVAYDGSGYIGEELANRLRARQEPRAAPSKTAPPKSGRAAAAPAPAPAAAAHGGGEGTDEYTVKLMVMMEKLQSEFISADEAVHGLWAELQAPDRMRFSTEFPQFMHYVIGLHRA